jgi:hypothetical protein
VYRRYLENLRSELNFRFHWSSEIYSLGKCYREVLRLPRFVPLLFTSDHGVNLGSAFDSGILELNEVHFSHLTWSSKVLELEGRLSSPKFQGFPHPWVTYRKIHGIEATAKNLRDEVIYFPIHSSGGSKPYGFDDEHAIEFLKRNFGHDTRVKICIAYGDLNSSRSSFYSTQGYEIVTVGSPWDPNFIDNFYNLIKDCKILVSEGYGSQVAYAIEFGVPVYIIPRLSFEIDEITGNIRRNQFEDYPAVESRVQYVEKLFGKLDFQISAEQIDFIHGLLGFEFLSQQNKFIQILRFKNTALLPYWFFKYLMFKNIKSIFWKCRHSPNAK